MKLLVGLVKMAESLTACTWKLFKELKGLRQTGEQA